mmetsp:Transcript_35577/g.85160  ORF Transcript_35577/g.85160 Transcript_35577/m.85160 type:complete len:261 (-) Transcript_35577:45-827(-)
MTPSSILATAKEPFGSTTLSLLALRKKRIHAVFLSGRTPSSSGAMAPSKARWMRASMVWGAAGGAASAGGVANSAGGVAASASPRSAAASRPPSTSREECCTRCAMATWRSECCRSGVEIHESAHRRARTSPALTRSNWPTSKSAKETAPSGPSSCTRLPRWMSEWMRPLVTKALSTALWNSTSVSRVRRRVEPSGAAAAAAALTPRSARATVGPCATSSTRQLGLWCLTRITRKRGCWPMDVFAKNESASPSAKRLNSP